MFSRYGIGREDNSAEPWFGDSAAAWATGFDAAASRDGTRIAVMEDDSADKDGTPRRGPAPLHGRRARRAPAFRCQLALAAADTYGSASPTFSPDGTRLAWAESNGIHVATSGPWRLRGDPRAGRDAPGAWEPNWTPATPATRPRGGKTTAPLTLAVQTRARPRRATLRRHGLRARVTLSAPAPVRVSVRVAGKRSSGGRDRQLGRRHDDRVAPPAPALPRSARRLVVHVSAAGAKPR